MEAYAIQWKRILRPSGTIYVFCSSIMSARLEVMFAKYFRPIGHITWSKPNEPGYDGWKGKMKKEALRSWYPHSERILEILAFLVEWYGGSVRMRETESSGILSISSRELP